MTTAVVWVDSRRRASGASDSDFEVALRETIHMSNARLRIDKVSFTDSFLTTDAGSHLYFSDGAGGIVSHPIPDGAYTGVSLAAAIQTATGRTTTYSALTNSITHDLAASSQPWLSDQSLEAYAGGGFPFGASRENPKSLNAVLGDGTNYATQVVWNWVRMSPYSCLFVRSSRLRCVDHHGPRGTHDILCSVPLTEGPGHQVVCSGDGIYYDLQGELSIRSFDIRLTDYLGRPVDLKGRPLALQLTFEG